MDLVGLGWHLFIKTVFTGVLGLSSYHMGFHTPLREAYEDGGKLAMLCEFRFYFCCASRKCARTMGRANLKGRFFSLPCVL